MSRLMCVMDYSSLGFNTVQMYDITILYSVLVFCSTWSCFIVL